MITKGRVLTTVGVVRPAVFVLAVAGCGGSSSPVAAPSAPKASPASGPATPAAAADLLTGTWQTASLPTAAFVRTYRKAGGTARQAQGFVALLTPNPSAAHRVVLHISDGQWVQFAQDDGATPEVGWTGTYRLDGSRVVAHETSTGCEVVYRVQVVAGDLRLRVLSTGPSQDSQCGSVGLRRAHHQRPASHRMTHP